MYLPEVRTHGTWARGHAGTWACLKLCGYEPLTGGSGYGPPTCGSGYESLTGGSGYGPPTCGSGARGLEQLP
jgi:hypothetical protein